MISTRLRTALIVAGLAAAVAFLPQGGDTADFLVAVITILLTIMIVLVVARIYQGYRTEIYGLGDRHRGLLYASIGAAVLAMAARGRLFETGAGVLAWLLIVGGASVGLYTVWRHWREHSI